MFVLLSRIYVGISSYFTIVSLLIHYKRQAMFSCCYARSTMSSHTTRVIYLSLALLWDRFFSFVVCLRTFANRTSYIMWCVYLRRNTFVVMYLHGDNDFLPIPFKWYLAWQIWLPKTQKHTLNCRWMERLIVATTRNILCLFSDAVPTMKTQIQCPYNAI